jgi:hypothetical protein
MKAAFRTPFLVILASLIGLTDFASAQGGRFSADLEVTAKTRKGRDWKRTWDVELDWNTFACGQDRLSFERLNLRGRKLDPVSRNLAQGARFEWDSPVTLDWRLPDSHRPLRWSRDYESVLAGAELDAKGDPSVLQLCGAERDGKSDCETQYLGRTELAPAGRSRIRVWGGKVELPALDSPFDAKAQWTGAFAFYPGIKVVARLIPQSPELRHLPSVELRGMKQDWSWFRVWGRIPMLTRRGDIEWRAIELQGPAFPMVGGETAGKMAFGPVSEATPNGLPGKFFGMFSIFACE